jgi:serine/threonine protein kinase
MGVVVSAHDVALDRKVAIKVVRPDRLAAEPEQGRARLLREAQAMARVSHPNVLTVHEVGTVDQDVFVVMEFVEGETLAAWMAGGPRPWRDVVRMFERAGRGLAAAHRAGLIHRDFKPENVLVTADGEVRVADFGLALSPGCRSAPTATALALSLTRTGSVLGTPIYMSPEQHRGEEVDARSDQFSFCVALYEALCGCRPFAGDSSGELLAAITERRLTAPVRAVARWLRAAVHRGLRPLPADRWPDMEALVDALSRDPARTRRPWLVRCGDAPPPRPRPSLRRRSRCE